MKTLYFARHAKSSWRDAQLSDIDRPLNARGVRDAYQMGSQLQSSQILPDVMISSPAVRAFHTAIIYARQLDFPLHRVNINQLLYSGGSAGVMEVIQHVDDKHDSIMVFGHNPTFTYLVNELSNSDLDNVPTAGVAAISFKIDTWANCGTAVGKLEHFLYPKLFEQS